MTANVTKARGQQVLRYLEEHRLDPTPAHYAFAHHLLFDEDKPFHEAVGKITEGSVRISAKQVEQLAPMLPGARAGRGAMGPQLDALTLRVLAIARDAASTTGDLNRDLVTAMAAMLTPEGQDLRSVVGKLIEQTSLAEASLGEASRQAHLLREELNALRTQSFTDELTGLLNQEGMEERLAAATARAAGFSLAMIEVDGLAAVTDQYGEAVRDRVLKVVAGTLAESCPTHTIGRLKGERFVVLFEDMAALDASTIVEGAREALVRRRLKLRENDKPLGTIGFSAGVATARSRDVPSVLAATASLLQQAKARGTNAIEVERQIVGL